MRPNRYISALALIALTSSPTVFPAGISRTSFAYAGELSVVRKAYQPQIEHLNSNIASNPNNPSGYVRVAWAYKEWADSLKGSYPQEYRALLKLAVQNATKAQEKEEKGKKLSLEDRSRVRIIMGDEFLELARGTFEYTEKASKEISKREEEINSLIRELLKKR